MNIVALHTDFRIYWPARLRALSEALKKRGDYLTVIEIAGKGSPYAFAQNSTDSELDWRILFPEDKPEDLDGKQIQKRLSLILDSIKPDVIIAGAIAFPSGALAVKYGQKHGTRIICFDDSKVETVRRSKLVEFVKKSVYSGVDAMLYPAPEWNETGKYWGFKENQMFYGVDVVDNDFWSAPQEFDNPWGNYFVSVGRQIPKKHHYDIVKAYIAYHENVGDTAYKLVLIGEGPEHERMLHMVTDAGLENDVIFLPFMRQAELPAIYQHAKAMIIASDIQETWGLVINEAMAGGCPVIASRECGASKPLVRDGENGYLFNCGDVSSLSEALLKLHNLPESEHKSMGEKALNAISNYGLDTFANGCLAAIDSAQNNPKVRPNLIRELIISKWNGQYRPT